MHQILIRQAFFNLEYLSDQLTFQFVNLIFNLSDGLCEAEDRINIPKNC